MSEERPPLSPEVRDLLEHERDIAPVPASVRARVLVRARASLVAGVVRRRTGVVAVPRVRWAAVAALVCVLGVAVGAAAYQIHTRFVRLSTEHPTAVQVGAVAPRPAVPPPAVPPAPVTAPVASARSTPQLSPAEAARIELRLLRQARGEVARGAYAAALQPIGEHARRFKDGRLAEEREALRVKSLAGLGRTEEAHRAAAAFRARFPRSVLLPAVSQMPASEP
jgi:hypothetical protein